MVRKIVCIVHVFVTSPAKPETDFALFLVYALYPLLNGQIMPTRRKNRYPGLNPRYCCATRSRRSFDSAILITSHVTGNLLLETDQFLLVPFLLFSVFFVSYTLSIIC